MTLMNEVVCFRCGHILDEGDMVIAPDNPECPFMKCPECGEDGLTTVARLADIVNSLHLDGLFDKPEEEDEL